MPRTKHPYDETPAEKIERWAIVAVTDDHAQQLALISLLHAFSEAAGNRSVDVEAVINDAMYAAFKQTDSLHDEAIAWLVAACEDRAVALTPKKRRPAKEVRREK